MKKIYFFVYLLLGYFSAFSQLNYTANDTIAPYEGIFRFGSNMGYYPPWKDEDLAELAAGSEAKGIDGLGIYSLRPGLFAHFLDTWGYDIRVDAFQYYQELGHDDNTAITGYPPEHQKDTNYYCSNARSELFANLYTPIWDNGENGTPVNDENYYALYLYKMVNRYGDYIRFWEIWNEPDFSYSTDAWSGPGFPGNWWENEPDPCDLAIKAPVTHYVRLLRISYEVIKTLKPDTYVALGGLGYPAFLDAVMRNTDNPVDGSPNQDYPLLGGAYFDVISIHTYPHIDGSLREWSNAINNFVYNRHSDAAAQGVLDRKRMFDEVALKYGYDGVQFPEKLSIITECNIPRVTFQDYIGSDEAQRNFLIKTVVNAYKENILQLYLFNLGDHKDEAEATSEFQLMGLYRNLHGATQEELEYNDGGIAYKTASELLYGTTYDAGHTAFLNLPSWLDGAAFKRNDNSYIYVFWAKTHLDQSELVLSNFTFPAILNIESLQRLEWDYSQTRAVEKISTVDIPLTGSPAFFIPTYRNQEPDDPGSEGEGEGETGGEEEKDGSKVFQVFPNPSKGDYTFQFYLEKDIELSLEITDINGRVVAVLFENVPFSRGYHTYLWQENDFQPGMYFCSFRPRRGEPELQKIVRVVEY